MGLALPLIGCAAVGPDYQRPAAIVPAQYKEIKGWKLATPRDDFAKGEWWKLFRDPELNTLEAQVAVSNQTLKADEANYREALALIAEARAGLYPTVNFNPSLTRASSQGLVGDTLNAQVSASWTLDVWGKVRRAIEQQGAGAQVSAADLANATLSAQSALALAYVQLRESDFLDDLLVDTVKQYNRSLAHLTEPVQRGNRRQIRRHHRAGVRPRRASPADQRRRRAGAERARHRRAHGQAAVRTVDCAPPARARRPRHPRALAIDACSRDARTSPRPSGRCRSRTPRSASPSPAIIPTSRCPAPPAITAIPS